MLSCSVDGGPASIWGKAWWEVELSSVLEGGLDAVLGVVSQL